MPVTPKKHRNDLRHNGQKEEENVPIHASGVEGCWGSHLQIGWNHYHPLVEVGKFGEVRYQIL